MVQIYDDNYAEAFALESYFIEEAYNQHKILSMINEAVCLESGDFSGLRAINESLVDGVKNFFSRIWEFVKKASSKFRERMSELLTTDKAFLTKYKEIILKKPLKDHELTNAYYYPNGVAEKNINSISQGDFSFDKYKAIIDQKVDAGTEFTEELFVEEVLKKVPVTKNNADLSKITEVNEYVKTAIQGDTTDYKMNQLNSTNLYNFCSKIDATNNQLEKNQKTLNTSSDKIIGIANQILSQTETNMKNESVYSSLYGKYITERDSMNIGDSSDKGKEGSGANGSTAGSQAAAVTANDSDSAQKMTDELNDKKENGDKKDKDTAKAENDKAQKQVEAYQVFFKQAVAVQTSLMTAVMAVYKDYMKLLRVHVRDYVGSGNEKTEGDHQAAQTQTPSQDSSKVTDKNQIPRGAEIIKRSKWNSYDDKKKASVLKKHNNMVYLQEDDGSYTKLQVTNK